MDLTQLKQQAARVATTKVEHPDDASFVVELARLNNRRMRQALSRAGIRFRLKAQRTNGKTPDDDAAEEALVESIDPYGVNYRRAFAEHVLIGWTGLMRDGQPVEPTLEERRAICCDDDLEPLYEWMLEQATRIAAEYEEERDYAAGKSQPSSGGTSSTAAE